MTSPKYTNLLSWARSNGAIIPESLVFPSTPYGHCRTTIPIIAGTNLFHIPHKILLTPTVAAIALPQLHDVSAHTMLSAFIALEIGKDGGFWKKYLDSLPKEVRTPAYFDEVELGALRGTNLSFAWRDRIEVWEKEFKEAKAVLPDLKWLFSFAMWLILRDDYLWASTVLSSRSFPSRLVTRNTYNSTKPRMSANTPDTVDGISKPSETIPNSSSDSSDPILIPVMDMLNHRPNHPVTWLTSPNAITYIAETSYPAGTEVFNNYGAKGNEECISPILSI